MTYVMSDIHGRLDRFEEVLGQINLQDSDRLYVLGDAVDRNEGGIALLFRLMEMPNATLLMGNHELMMRQCLFEDDDCEMWLSSGGCVTLSEYFSLSAAGMLKLWHYLDGLPFESEVSVNGSKYVLAHALPPSVYIETQLPKDEKHMARLQGYAVWAQLEADEAPFSDKTLVFGHTLTAYYQQGMPMRAWHGKGLIGIDCGCSFSAGRLLCLRLDDMKEFYSAQ